MNLRHTLGRVISAGTVLLAAGSIAGPVGSAGAAPGVTITPVLGGLAAPRGIAFDGQGSMYVSQSGVSGPGEEGMTNTGLVSKYPWGQTTPAWSAHFNSLYEPPPGAAPGTPPDVLGPEGISAVGNGCMKNSNGQRNGCEVQMVTSESTPGSGGTDLQAGHLFRLDGATGAVTDLADVGSQMYAFTDANQQLFPPDFPDANPYGVLVTKGVGGGIRTFVADAAANTVSEVMPDGTARIIAYIPNENFGAFRDSTPTCIAQGPDGYLYVGTLDFISNLFVPPGLGGLSSVWRVDPNANYPTAPQRWATGLTTVTACTFDSAGNFWAAEMFAGGLGATPPGDIVEIPFSNPTQQTHIGAGHLPVPGGIAQGPDGAMYVTVGSSAPGVSGAVVRVSVQ
jgi:hypothetical protein